MAKVGGIPCGTSNMYPQLGSRATLDAVLSYSTKASVQSWCSADPGSRLVLREHRHWRTVVQIAHQHSPRLPMLRNKSVGSCDVDRALAGSTLSTGWHDVALSTHLSEPDAQLDLEDISPCTAPVHPQVAHLPENVVRHIAHHALQSGGRQNSILALLAMCGVCTHWRQAASCVDKGTGLIFDGTKAQTSNSATTTYEQKFRTLPQGERARILHAAAQLLRGA